MSKTSIFVRIDADHTLSIEDVWPDGDAPENPTAADVKAVMEKCGYRSAVLNDWGLEVGVFVAVGHGEEVEVWPLASGQIAATEGDTA